MSNSVIIYNQPEQKLQTVNVDQSLAHIDLSAIDLPDDVNLTSQLKAIPFALVFDGTNWISQTYMQWEDLRINEALQAVKDQYSKSTQTILTHFVASMDIKYQGNKSWIELLNELGKEIEGL